VSLNKDLGVSLLMAREIREVSQIQRLLPHLQVGIFVMCAYPSRERGRERTFLRGDTST
jgi:hypothetical protein